MDDRIQELYELSSKQAALEVGGEAQTEEYHQLSEQVESLREDLDAAMADLSAEAARSDIPSSRGWSS